MITTLLKQNQICFRNINAAKRWEYIKEDVKKASMKFSIQKANENGVAISQLQEAITEYENSFTT